MVRRFLRKSVKPKLAWLKGRIYRVYGKYRMLLSGGFRSVSGISQYRPAEVGNSVIGMKLREGRPLMVARYGLFELRGMIHGWGKTRWSDESVMGPLCNNAGFFPRRIELLGRFSAVYREAARNIDVFCAWLFRHGLWRWEEYAFRELCPGAVLTDIRALDAFLYSQPWSSALEGRRVLVVHPFSKSIERQYQRRELLFQNPRVLPQFGSLEVLPAVQSAAQNVTGFQDWFEALAFMQDQMRKREFDVALIGAGAYGMPLAAYAKTLGKQAIHLGGVTQILFGIIGSRWESWYPWLFNEHWIRPSAEERPKGAERIENACYW